MRSVHRIREHREVESAQTPHDAGPHASQVRGRGEQNLESDFCQLSKRWARHSTTRVSPLGVKIAAAATHSYASHDWAVRATVLISSAGLSNNLLRSGPSSRVSDESNNFVDRFDTFNYCTGNTSVDRLVGLVA